ncbi:putative membrane protein [Lishizhenia tianjinensis]|uniref:Putative membrane protein n=1 Tax=Lishizhenia tianjinensis TaxID=477690 RepID=A0A1I6XZS8_9FLAO|nr:DUF368 domain-containing protein [Lishizhenia tianjinensis]SFT43820.1 putative membrane protein [Lishizhenia tianjinensis]
MKERNLLQYLMVSLRGLAMGAADAVPGVSGGTIAFITGIYEELISSLSNINLSALKVLKAEGLKAFWKHINGNFFVALFGGIAVSLITLSRIIVGLLEHHPVLLWSFFFGLVIASTLLIVKTIQNWNLANIIGLIIGAVIAGYISLAQNTAGQANEYWYIFLSGAIAICAMILPGISGAFILVLMGSYATAMNGLKSLDFALIAVFASGCLVGLLSFSKLLKYLFAHYKNLTLAILSGFLLGSLLKIWPWKNNISDVPYLVHSDGRAEFMQANVLPQNYNGDSQLTLAILLVLAGLALILLMDRFAPKETS